MPPPDTKLDVLAIGAHPDDVELSCGGTLLRLAREGYAVGVLDLTRGEMGTRGTPDTRAQEAAAAAELLGLRLRGNAGLPDGALENSPMHRLAIVPFLRAWRPALVLCNAPQDRHPDHGQAAALVRDACFLSGLAKISTQDAEGRAQAPWRPERLYHYIQDQWLMPSFVVDISPYHAQKLSAIAAYGTQFYNPELTEEPETYISRPDFWQHLSSRDREMGHLVGVTYGEGFLSTTPLLLDLLPQPGPLG